MILIGELRDSESAETALQAAESGHLVVSTMHTIDASETVARMVEFFPAGKQTQVRSILAGVLRGVVSQRLLPRTRRWPRRRVRGDGRTTTGSPTSIRENRPEEISEAIADGEFFHMQTLTAALIDLVLAGEVDRDVAAGAAPNHHDFVIALEHAAEGDGGRTRRRRTSPSMENFRACDSPPAPSASPHDRAHARPARRRPAARHDSRGMALTEMIVVLAILVVVLTALTQLFVSASHGSR